MTGHIIYRLEATDQPGKTAKIPLSLATLRAANPHDPANWLPDRVTAELTAAALGVGYGVGLVITSDDPYWFLDLDGCKDATGDWTPAAKAICAALTGAYVEVSQSGQGLHLIGRGTLPPHAVEVKGLGGLYHEKRFCALTGSYASGSMDAELTAAITAVALQYFPPREGDDSGAADWTTAPCEGYGGPADDDDLIRLARSVSSAGAAFGGRASFGQLWDGDETALSKQWPQSHRPYDCSAADAALAQHLAFWTGKDCERIERLMRRSALAREKWDREAYIHGTIMRACRLQGPVATGAKRATAPSTAGGAPAAEVPSAPSAGFLLASDLPRHFEGVVYIEDRYVAAVPDGSLLSPQQFRSNGRYGGYKFPLDDTKTTRNAWECLVEGEMYRPPMANGLCFRPELPSRALVEDCGKILLNNYVPISTPSTPGDAGPFLRHLAKLLPDDRDRAILLAYMAAVIQKPGCKFGWAPIIQGCEGNGKSLLISVMEQAVGERYSHMPSAQDLSNKFNAWLERKIFVGIEELYIQDKRDLLDTLKVYVTNRRLEFQGKGADQVTADNRANFIACTNHKDAVPKTNNDRRYAVFFTAQQSAEDIARDGMGGSYFPDLYGWLRAGGYAIVTHYLQTHAIPAELDPAGAMHRAPHTTSTPEAIRASLGPVEQAIVEAIESEEAGFRGGWVSSTQLGSLLDARRMRGRAHPNQWTAIMRGIGYIPHPALHRGRVNNGLQVDGGKKSSLWVREGSIPALNLDTPVAVAAAYSAANGQGAPGLAAASG